MEARDDRKRYPAIDNRSHLRTFSNVLYSALRVRYFLFTTWTWTEYKANYARSPRRKVFTFQPIAKWSDDAAQQSTYHHNIGLIWWLRIATSLCPPSTYLYTIEIEIRQAFLYCDEVKIYTVMFTWSPGLYSRISEISVFRVSIFRRSRICVKLCSLALPAA